MLPSHPLPAWAETEDEKLVREEGERLIDMYASGTEPYLRGKAMLRIVQTAAQHRVQADASGVLADGIRCPECWSASGGHSAKCSRR